MSLSSIYSPEQIIPSLDKKLPLELHGIIGNLCRDGDEELVIARATEMLTKVKMTSDRFEGPVAMRTTGSCAEVFS